MSFEPLQDRVAVETIEEENKTSILIPDTAKEKPLTGRVLGIGQGTRDANGTLHPLQVKVGDKIAYTKWAGTEVKIDGKNVVFIKESDILCIIR